MQVLVSCHSHITIALQIHTSVFSNESDRRAQARAQAKAKAMASM